MANFIIAFNLTSRYEGGLSNNPEDNGKLTYMGIASAYFPNWVGWGIIKQAITKNETESLRINQQLNEMVQSFYKNNFWNPLSLDKINDQQIANAVYDFGVNAGITTSAKRLQTACNVAADGQIGNETIDAVNKGNAKEIYNNFNGLRKQYYQTIAEHPGQSQFLASWLNRIKPYQV
jgi:lysozyme family protein